MTEKYRRDILASMAAGTAALAGCSAQLEPNETEDDQKKIESEDFQPESRDETWNRDRDRDCSQAVLDIFQGEEEGYEVKQIAGEQPLGKVEVRWSYEDGSRITEHIQIRKEREIKEIESKYNQPLERIELEPECKNAATAIYEP